MFESESLEFAQSLVANHQFRVVDTNVDFFGKVERVLVNLGLFFSDGHGDWENVGEIEIFFFAQFTELAATTVEVSPLTFVGLDGFVSDLLHLGGFEFIFVQRRRLTPEVVFQVLFYHGNGVTESDSPSESEQLDPLRVGQVKSVADELELTLIVLEHFVRLVGTFEVESDHEVKSVVERELELGVVFLFVLQEIDLVGPTPYHVHHFDFVVDEVLLIQLSLGAVLVKAVESGEIFRKLVLDDDFFFQLFESRVAFHEVNFGRAVGKVNFDGYFPAILNGVQLFDTRQHCSLTLVIGLEHSLHNVLGPLLDVVTECFFVNFLHLVDEGVNQVLRRRHKRTDDGHQLPLIESSRLMRIQGHLFDQLQVALILDLHRIVQQDLNQFSYLSRFQVFVVLVLSLGTYLSDNSEHLQAHFLDLSVQIGQGSQKLFRVLQSFLPIAQLEEDKRVGLDLLLCIHIEVLLFHSVFVLDIHLFEVEVAVLGVRSNDDLISFLPVERFVNLSLVGESIGERPLKVGNVLLEFLFVEVLFQISLLMHFIVVLLAQQSIKHFHLL